MSALPHENHTDHVESHDQTIVASTPVVVRRHAGISLLIGAAASAVAIAYLWRASQTMTVLDWSLCAVMSAIAATYLAALVDSRTPLLVADELGVRIRLGREWRGLPWEGVEKVVVQPRRGLLRDGRIEFAPHNLARALEGLDAKSRRRASLNQKMYGAALVVPVGITTRVSTHGELSVVEEFAALSRGRAAVLEIAPDPEVSAEAAATTPETIPVTTPDLSRSVAPDATPDATLHPTAAHLSTYGSTYGSTHVEADGEADGGVDLAPSVTEHEGRDTARPARRRILGGIGTIVSRVAKGRGNDADLADDGNITDSDDDVTGDVTGDADADGAPLAPAALAGAVPLRATRPALRAEVTRDAPATLGNAALKELAHDAASLNSLPESRELHRPGSVDLVFEREGVGGSARVRPISTLGDVVEPLVIDDFVTEPAYDPVIGPELTAARTRLGMSVDDLADRTRIRPHVIESIEVDDFAPCGGDFYARGHLRTLARVLGKDPVPLLESFEGRYATAPVNARRVFEAELATGMTGSMRSTIGGPNWGLMIGMVITLVLVWGVVRLFAGEPAELIQSPVPVLNGSTGVNEAEVDAGRPEVVPVMEPLALMLTAAYGDTVVVVRDGSGRITFSGEMVLGEKKRLAVTPPVKVRAVDAGAIEVAVRGRDRGVLGELGEPGRRTFR